MQMQTVPTSLIGASLGEAHKWVREQMVFSNPGKPMADYKLTDENGKPISLSDLTRGNATHVTIVGAGSTVRKNPAHPAEIAGFMEIPKPMHRNRLNALTQDDITPALYNAMVNEYGLFGATTLSILLTRPVFLPSSHSKDETSSVPVEESPSTTSSLPSTKESVVKTTKTRRPKQEPQPRGFERIQPSRSH